MTRRKEEEPLQKVTLNVFKSDYDWLGEQYPALGRTKAIRQLVRMHRLQIEGAKASVTDSQLELELELDLELEVEPNAAG